MSKDIRYSLVSIIILLALFACNLSNPTNNDANTNAVSGNGPAVGLTKQALNTTAVFNAVGQMINYSYTVSNTGNTSLTGPVTVTDDKATVLCPEVNTIGNLNTSLDPGENITCTSSYSITQADLTNGSVTNSASAHVGGVDSNTATATVHMAENKVLTITKSANPATYNQTGQIITFTYVVKNTGTAKLGPTQFVVTDNRISAPINCGPQGALLATNESVSCIATYNITQNDMGASSITNSASASGGGAGTIQPATVTITNTNISGSSNYVRGSTIQHNVVEGEWMIQIARCYGADFDAVRNANPQVIDPHWILPAMTLTVPNLGSNGTIYGPPCVVFYPVQSGDTWASIAQKYNADVLVLQEANKDLALTTGTTLKVPRNSAGGTQPPPSNQPIRITFPTGSTTVTLMGSVNPQNTIRYALSANQGQTLGIKLTAPINEVNLAVYAPNGTTLKQPDTTLTWTGTIAANGDHFIDVIATFGTNAKSYTLEVSLSAPPTQQVERVADINAGTGDSNPAYMSVFNGTLYFQADGNDGTGAELWKYDSALKTASRVSDIQIGDGGSQPAYLTEYNGNLYFRANGNDGAGVELWRFNGTATGRVADIFSGTGDANPAHMAVFNNVLYFSANGNDGTGAELWKFDGTTAGRVADILSGTGDSNPAYLAVFNNVLYFSATSTDGAGTELWKYDGTSTSRVSDINVGIGSSNPSFLTVFNNMLYFTANGNDGAGTELWKFDGTTASRAADITSGAGDSVPTFLTVFNGALYFGANGNDGTGFELWKFDDTNASRVSDINKTGDSSPAYLSVFNNELYFQANGGDVAGKELWKFKGP